MVPRSAYAYWGGTWNVQGELKRIKRYGTTYVGDKAQKFIEEAEERDKRPWFAYLAPPAPHAPFKAEDRYQDRNTTINFREYYDLVNDPYQLTNLFGDVDPLNDPPDAVQLSLELREARGCASPQQCP